MNLKENNLRHSSNPYLLQHAANPVHWQGWDEEVLDAARRENRLLIISIGYSSCHWCHVMERECFEDEEVATVMNQHYLAIKVDREEQPDVDEVYMTALQLMTQQGGWPLNIVALPDGRPVWGATYVPRDSWIKVLSQLAEMQQQQAETLEDYAQKLTRGVQQSSLVPMPEEEGSWSMEEEKSLLENWRPQWDDLYGGTRGAPKFPLPGSWRTLLHLATLHQDQKGLEQVRLSLEQMAYGGIYDHVGGGFARYATDSLWKVPHFEKMLYDNAQLISLYSEAYRQDPRPLYRRIVEESIAFVERELSGPEGQCYSAIDADSEGGEGRYYVWTKAELEEVISPEDWETFAAVFQVNERGYWEEGRYILHRRESLASLAERQGMKEAKLGELCQQWLRQLHQLRQERPRPQTDDKALTSWNALMIRAYVDAYRSWPCDHYLAQAQQIARWLENRMLDSSGQLYHSYRQQQARVTGLLEDYAGASSAWIDLYEVTAEPHYLEQARNWMQRLQREFLDSNGFYFSRSKEAPQLIARSQETSDLVLPSGNALAAQNLYRLSHHLGEPSYREQVKDMLSTLKPRLRDFPGGHYQWIQILLWQEHPFYEVAITGPQAFDRQAELLPHYLPQSLIIASPGAQETPLLAQRHHPEKTRLFVCQEGACQQPVTSVEEALGQMKNEAP